MEEVLERHFAGTSLREFAEERGCSPETVGKEIRAAKRAHITQMAGELLLARRTGELVVLVVPGHSGPDFDVAIGYLTMVVHEIEDLGIKLKIHVTNTEAGVAYGLQEELSASAQEEK